jgi:ADP-ribose pyrophosphatase YjhB (NUDIX family)
MTFSFNMSVRTSGLVFQDESILLVESYAEVEGLHFILPGGAVLAGETIHEALRREIREETCVDVEVGPLVLAYEYAPHKDRIPSGLPPALTLVFACRPVGGAARLPDCPDAGQTGVRWIDLDELDGLALSPPIQKPILDYVYQGKTGVEWIEEWKR